MTQWLWGHTPIFAPQNPQPPHREHTHVHTTSFTPTSTSSTCTSPPTPNREVRLYVNRASMGFSDVDAVPAAHSVTLTPEQAAAGEPIVLKLAKFGNGAAGCVALSVGVVV